MACILFLRVIALTQHNYFEIFLGYDKNGEGNGTPLQYSCLENPMDGGTW